MNVGRGYRTLESPLSLLALLNVNRGVGARPRSDVMIPSSSRIFAARPRRKKPVAAQS